MRGVDKNTGLRWNGETGGASGGWRGGGTNATSERKVISTWPLMPSAVSMNMMALSPASAAAGRGAKKGREGRTGEAAMGRRRERRERREGVGGVEEEQESEEKGARALLEREERERRKERGAGEEESSRDIGQCALCLPEQGGACCPTLPTCDL